MAIIGIELKGLKELDNELKALPEKLQREIVHNAIMEGSKVVYEDAIKRIPMRSKEWKGMKYKHPAGSLKAKGLFIGLAKKTKRSITSYFVGTNQKYGWYGLFLEFGHLRVAKKNVRDRFKYKSGLTGKTRGRPGRILGFIPAKPFLLPALTAKASEAIEKMRITIKEYIDKYKPTYAIRK